MKIAGQHIWLFILTLWLDILIYYTIVKYRRLLFYQVYAYCSREGISECNVNRINKNPCVGIYNSSQENADH